MNPNINDGKMRESKFVESIDGKKVSEVPNILKANLKLMFKKISDNDVIKAELIEGSQKPDFSITIKEMTKNVSLKTGTATQVGSTGLKMFIGYLRSLGVSETTLKTIVYCHFCDGTLNNTGKVRHEFNDYKKKFEKEILEANKELNGNKELVKSVVKKIVFDGFYEENIPADYLYFGTEEYGNCCNYIQVCKLIDYKKWAYINNLHIGPIQFRPVARYAHKRVRNDQKRWGIRFYWCGLSPEVERMSKQFYYYHDGYVPKKERVASPKGSKILL